MDDARLRSTVNALKNPVPPQRPLLATDASHLKVVITDDGSPSLLNEALAESYHSGCGAASETYHVYLRNSGVAERFMVAPSRPTRILEYGFGTGLGFFLSAALALKYRGELHYVSLEHQLLSESVFSLLSPIHALANIESQFEVPKLSEEASLLFERWMAFRQSLPQIPATGTYQCNLAEGILLQLVIGDAAHFQPEPCWFDAVFFDPFSPKTNPELWTEVVLQKATSGLKPGGSLVSYCVNSQVRKMLHNLSLEVERLPGPPGGKREVLRVRCKV